MPGGAQALPAGAALSFKRREGASADAQGRAQRAGGLACEGMKPMALQELTATEP